MARPSAPSRAGLVLILAALPLLVSACCGRALRDGEPLHDAVDARRYLARPFSGAPEISHPHVFGPGLVVPAGLPIRVESVAALEPGYRIRFSGPEACRPHCTLRLHPAPGESAEAAFEAHFSRRDPLAALDAGERDHVAAHRVAAGMRAETIRLSLGEPDRIERFTHLGSPAVRWIYVRRVPDGRYRWSTTPHLALVLAADQVIDYAYLAEAEANVSDGSPTPRG